MSLGGAWSRVLPIAAFACHSDSSSLDWPPSPAESTDRVGNLGARGCVRLSDERLACWNDSGHADVVAAHVHGVVVDAATCTRFDAGIKCWGERNDYGAMGYGDAVPRGDVHDPSPPVDDLPYVDLGDTAPISGLAAGTSTCAVFTDGRLKCWGRNSEGSLGLGDEEHRGDEPGEMGEQLPYVDLGTDARVERVATRGNTTCAVLDDGRLKCWGYNGNGELGLGDREDRGDEPGEMGDALPAVDLGPDENAVAVAIGDAHVCAVLTGGGLKCWGRNHVIYEDDPTQTPYEGGRLGYEDLRDRGAAPEDMGSSLPFVDVGTGKGVLAVGAGIRHTCALLDSGEVKCWGGVLNSSFDAAENFMIYDDIGDDPGEMGDALPAYDLGGRRAIALAVNDDSNCALLEDGAVHCWGVSNDIEWPIELP